METENDLWGKYWDYKNNVLKNKLGIKDSENLSAAERFITERKYRTIPDGNFDYKHLKAIHKHLFSEIYEWAGEERLVNIAKGSTSFCYTQFITPEINKSLTKLAAENHLKDITSKDEFIDKFSNYFADINAIHPFREGNGRSTRAFFSLLAKETNFKVNFSKIKNQEKWLEASIESFHSDEPNLLKEIISGITKRNILSKTRRHNKSIDISR